VAAAEVLPVIAAAAAISFVEVWHDMDASMLAMAPRLSALVYAICAASSRSDSSARTAAASSMMTTIAADVHTACDRGGAADVHTAAVTAAESEAPRTQKITSAIKDRAAAPSSHASPATLARTRRGEAAPRYRADIRHSRRIRRRRARARTSGAVITAEATVAR
jgi:hypothetical protein